MVEIIPKEEEISISFKELLFYFSVILFAGVLVMYFISLYIVKQRNDLLINLENRFESSITPQQRATERKVLNYKNKINDFSTVFSNRKMVSNFFIRFEKLIHPQVWVSSFSLNAEEMTVSFSGLTDNFITLQQQLDFLRSQKDKGINDVFLDNVKITEEGEVTFDLKLSLTKDLFKEELLESKEGS